MAQGWPRLVKRALLGSIGAGHRADGKRDPRKRSSGSRMSGDA